VALARQKQDEARGRLDMVTEMPRYWTALGRFIDHFSRVEFLLTRIAQSLTGLDDSVFLALLSGARIDQLVGVIKRLMDVIDLDPERADHLQIALSKLPDINRMRNDIVHFGWQADAMGMKVTNLHMVHLAARKRETSISTEKIDDVTHDLNRIIGHLWLVLCFDSIEPAMRSDFFGGALQREWRFR
jgi:hypothetical protein